MKLLKPYTQTCEVLLDDRDIRPGVMFADADLIGIPRRIVLGKRSLQQGAVEYQQRGATDHAVVPLSDCMQKIIREV